MARKASATRAFSNSEIRVERLRARRRSYPLWRLARANWLDVVALMRSGGWIPLVALLLVVLSSTAYLLLVYFPAACAAVAPLPCDTPGFVEALYETLQLIVFQSGLDFPADALGRLLFFLVPLLGLFFLLQSLVDLARQLFNKGARREEWQASLASTYNDHIIVCGLGRVGYRVTLQLLDAGYDVVAIDINWNSPFVKTVLALNTPVIHGDARDPEVLSQAGIERARAILAVVNNDTVNMEIALNARRYRADIHTILRIFNAELDTRLEERFGQNTAFSSSTLAAPTFTAAAISRDVSHVLSFPEGFYGIAEITITRESKLSGFLQNIEEQFDVRVIRHGDAQGRERRAGFLSTLEANDRVVFLGSIYALEQLRLANQFSRAAFGQKLQRPDKQFNTVIVCGLGRIGARVVQMLRLSEPAPEVVVICSEETPDNAIEEVEHYGARTIRGDARDSSVLLEAGIDRAYSVAAMFSDDLRNVQIGLTARNMRPDVHLVLRVFSDVLAEGLTTLFGSHAAFSTSALAAPTLASAAIMPGVAKSFDVGEQLFGSLNVTVQANDSFAGRRIKEIRELTRILVIIVRRNGHALPNLSLETVVQPGDELVVVAELNVLAALPRNTLTPTSPPATRKVAQSASKP
jgi:Trk K+ transport system NAD-binding subunit